MSMNPTTIAMSPHAHIAGQVSLMQRAINKSTQKNVQAGEIHYGAIAGPPIQCHAVAGAGSGGANAGSNIRKVPVYIDGNKTSQLCAFPADYYPMTNDVVKLILVGTDKKARGHYLVLNRLASGQDPDHDTKTVASTVAEGVIVGSGLTSILSFDPFAVFGNLQGFFRVSWGVKVPGSQTITAQVVTSEANTAITFGLAGSIAGTSTETNFFAATTASTHIAGAARSVKWTATATGYPVKVVAASASGTGVFTAIIEQVG